MSPSTGCLTTLQPYVLRSLVVVCFLLVFFAYIKSDLELPSFNFSQNVRPPCPTVQCANRTLTQDSNKNCSSEPHINPHPNDTQKTQAAAVDTEPDTILLIWMWPFNTKFDISCSQYNIHNCKLTDDKRLYSKAHGVFFHHRDINGFPQEPRPYFQKWVWFNVESPANSRKIPGIDNVFNVTCNYRLDSNIPMRYGYLVPRPSEVESFKLPAKDKLVCWIVSHWNPGFKRVQFYNELKKHINISTYGNGFGNSISTEDYSKIISSCKFYLSFENSVCKDYITEKLYNAMNLGSVPVVLGTSRPNYEDHVPGESFIHVDDYSTPKELAERLLYLDQNITEYMRYFNWRNRFKVQRTQYGREHACRTCSHLRKNRQYQTIHDLNKWYYG